MNADKDIEIHYFSSAYEQDAMRVVRKKASPDSSKQALAVEHEGPYSYNVIEEGEGAPYARIVSYDGAEQDISVPERLGDYVVRELGDRAFSKAKLARTLHMPQTVRICGKNVFTGCSALESLEFSDDIAQLDASVLSACRALRDIHLPASLEVLPSRLLADCPVERLEIPRATQEVQERAFDVKKIVEFSVDPGNERFMTDGTCLYSKDATILERACAQVDAYEVMPTCARIEKGAFKGMSTLGKVTLGPSVTEIGAFAFFGTSLDEIAMPDSLQIIGEKAFCQCKNLSSVDFGVSLTEIGERAFAQTALESVCVPKSVRRLGVGAFDLSGIDYADPNSFSIDAENPYLATDNSALYAKRGACLTLVRSLRPLTEYAAVDGTEFVAECAFENNRTLERLTLPEGVKRVGDKALKGCSKLAAIELPSTLESIGEQAFWGTALSNLKLGRAVTEIGECALSVAGDSRTKDKARIETIDVDSANERFVMDGPMLIEHTGDGDVIRLYTGNENECVRIPDTVTEVSDLAFYHMRARELHVCPNLKKIAPRAFLGLSGLRRVYVEYDPPLEGYERVVIEYTPEPRDKVDMSRPLCFDKADGRFFDYDAFDSMVVHEYEPGDVGRMALSRLAQPVKLKGAFKAGFDAALKGFLPQIVEAFERDGYEEGLERLERFGYRQGI